MRGESRSFDPLAGRRVLVAITGSIAAVKLPQLVSALAQRGTEVRCLLSPAAIAATSTRINGPISLRDHCMWNWRSGLN